MEPAAKMHETLLDVAFFFALIVLLLHRRALAFNHPSHLPSRPRYIYPSCSVFNTAACVSSLPLLATYRSNDGDEDEEDSISDALDSIGFKPEVQQQSQDDALLGYGIDSFLRGDYDLQFAEDAAAPHPGLSPGSTIETCIRSLRQLDSPWPFHGAAVLMRFCVPLSRGERWGDSTRVGQDPWKEALRGALTPTMLARRIRASEFSGLLDWTSLDVTEGAYSVQKDLVGLPSIAFVNAALYFSDGVEPSLIQFTLRRVGGVWLIDTARQNPKDLFVEKKDQED